ncbi:MAG: hypothetical protein J6328_00740 [Bacilli bacterium]|nr:hypothetical protein [Bacilli bacterium]
MTLPIEEFAKFPTLRLQFMTNDRGASFLHWDERGAKLSDLRVRITYSKELDK